MSPKTFLNLLEMPDFSRQGTKVKDSGGRQLRDLSVDEVEANIGFMHLPEGTFFTAPGFTMAWFFDTEEAARAAGSTPGYCPPLFQDYVNVSDRFSGRSPIKGIWNKRKGPHSALDASVVGAIRAYIDDSTIYLDMISVRPGWKRNSVAAKLTAALKNHWPGRALEHSETTSDGHRFLKATGNLQHDKRDGGGEWDATGQKRKPSGISIGAPVAVA